MRCHSLCVLQCAAGFEIGGDAGRPEDVAAELLFEAGLCRTVVDHPIGVDAVHQLASQFTGSAARGAQQGAFAIVADAGGGEIFVDEGFELVMHQHFVALAAFLVDPQSRAVIPRV